MRNEKSEKNSLCIKLIVLGAVTFGLVQTEIKETLLDTKEKVQKTKNKIKKIARLLCKKCPSS